MVDQVPGHNGDAGSGQQVTEENEVDSGECTGSVLALHAEEFPQIGGTQQIRETRGDDAGHVVAPRGLHNAQFQRR